MSRITTEHLSREAIIYVRQSTMKQVLGNPGSREWQYGLRDRAGALGWPEPVVIDEDLGRSGGGGARDGFDRMLGAVCRARSGSSWRWTRPGSRRNGMEWHRLIDMRPRRLPPGRRAVGLRPPDSVRPPHARSSGCDERA